MIHDCVKKFYSELFTVSFMCNSCVCVCALTGYIYLDDDGCLHVLTSSFHDQFGLEQ